MRWTEIVDHATQNELHLPTYRKMDLWTRAGKLTAETRGDNHGRFRWWPRHEVEAALLVARLMSCGMDEDLSFLIARTDPDPNGQRTLLLDGGKTPAIRVTVDPK